MERYTSSIVREKIFPKICMKFISDRKYLYSGWEINKINMVLNNSYYKNEILNTIISSINDGYDPQNIYVLDSSVAIGQKYNNLKSGELDLRSPQGVTDFYHLGSPHPLVPDKKAFLLYYAFEIYKVTYTFCKKSKLKNPDKRTTLFNFYTKICTDMKIDFDKELIESIRKVNVSFDNNKEKKYREIIKKLMAQYNKVYELDMELSTLENELTSKKSSYKDFSRFDAIFKVLDRPIVVINDKDSGKLRILCSDLIVMNKFTDSNYRFFETKTVSQNSPLIIIIAVGIGYVSHIINSFTDISKINKEFKRRNSNTSDHEKYIELINKGIIEVSTNKLDEIELTKLKKLVYESRKNSLEFQDKYALDKLIGLQDESQSDTNEFFKKNNIKIDKINII